MQNTCLELQKRLEQQAGSHDSHVTKAVQAALEAKNVEVRSAQERVSQVEEEMKQLLSETAKERKAMEDKFQKLSHAFHDLQKELT